MVNSFYRSKKYLIPTTIPYIYMKQIKAQTEHGSHIRAGATHSSVSSFDKFQNLLHILMCVCVGGILHSADALPMTHLCKAYRHFIAMFNVRMSSILQYD